jgi:methylamine---glutamate N-methyltransferase subunit A
MCGIVGLFGKSPEMEESLGQHLAAMVAQMSDRGPDSAGVAVYRDAAPSGWSKLTLFSADALEDWSALADELRQVFGGSADPSVRASHAVLLVEAEAAEAEAWVRRTHPDLRVMSAGQAIEIYKETGRPEEFVRARTLSATRGWRPRAG